MARISLLHQLQDEEDAREYNEYLMSLLSPTSDFLGNMSQSELNSQDIQNLQDEITRLQQNQDSINQTLNIIAQGRQSVTVTAGGSGSLILPLTTLTANTYLVYVSPADKPGQFFTVPYYDFNTSSVLTTSFLAYATASNGTTTPGLTILYLYPNATTLTFYYFIIQQPANVAL